MLEKDQIETAIEWKREYTKISNEFIDIFFKYMKKCPRIAIIACIHSPLNCIMNMIQDTENIHEIMPDLPYVFIRMMMPFIELEQDWGHISGQEFVEKYRKIFDSQFTNTFEEGNVEDIQLLKKWYDELKVDDGKDN